jgi:hypothetical protein
MSCCEAMMCRSSIGTERKATARTATECRIGGLIENTFLVEGGANQELRLTFAMTTAVHRRARLHDLRAIDRWGRAGDQALRRSAFQEAISHLGKAIEMADKLGDSAPRAATAATASAGERLKLTHLAIAIARNCTGI